MNGILGFAALLGEDPDLPGLPKLRENHRLVQRSSAAYPR